MRAVFTKLLADVRRRRMQSILTAIIVLIASGTGTVALNLITQSTNPYTRVFDQQMGGHLQVFFDGDRVTREQLVPTGRSLGAASVGGPWRDSAGLFQLGNQKFLLTLVARGDPGGDIDRLRLVAGRWVGAPNEIVVTYSLAQSMNLTVGDQLLSVSESRPVMKVVGVVVDVDQGDAQSYSQMAWVSAQQLTSLTADFVHEGYLMTYRFEQPPTAAELDQATEKLKAELPPGAVRDTVTYLFVKKLFDVANSVILTFLIAFSALALVVAGALIANLVGGVVVAHYRELGILKAIGFTERQVTLVLVGQMLVPALVGSAIGIPAGMAASQPLLNRSSQALGLPSILTVSPLVGLLVLVAVLLVVALAGWLAALPGARMNVARAITSGVAPKRGRASWLGRRLVRLPLPRPLSLGAADALIRPVRSGFTVLAVALAVASVTFAIGLHASLGVLAGLVDPPTAQVDVRRATGFSDVELIRALNAQSETRNIVAMASERVTVPGIANPFPGIAMRGNSAELQFPVFKGRWFSGPGEAVAPRGLLQDAHLNVGDTVTATINGQPIKLTIVGENFDLNNFGHSLRFDYANLAEVDPKAQPTEYLIQLKPGSDVAAYSKRVHDSSPDLLSVQNPSDGSDRIKIVDGVVLALTATLLLMAVAGVFNTMLLNTRERLHDIGVLKAIGMAPRQTLLMVASSAGLIGLVGAVIGIPSGTALQRGVLQLLAQLFGTEMPDSVVNSLGTVVLLGLVPALAAAGVAVAVVGALLPARWAARTPTVTVLHYE